MKKKTVETKKIEMPSISSYGNYSSSNYGAHCLRVEVAGVTVWFSYTTPVAFRGKEGGTVVRKNDWSTTTGKHLNLIDGGSPASKKERVSGEDFEKAFAVAMGGAA